ncbi:hypothetical protein QWA68_001465 [Fusarium oxysporum]|nr:hypothetical protein QWA68_001465 [Fusarium oxysporum]
MGDNLQSLAWICVQVPSCWMGSCETELRWRIDGSETTIGTALVSNSLPVLRNPWRLRDQEIHRRIII